jgi:hypothetical protein
MSPAHGRSSAAPTPFLCTRRSKRRPEPNHQNHCGEVLDGRIRVVDADSDNWPDADASVLVEVVHCMDDANATALLRRCPGQTAYVAERVLPADGRASRGHLDDLHMLVMFGGRERTRREFADLFKSAGLQLRRVLQTDSWVSVLVATRLE